MVLPLLNTLIFTFLGVIHVYWVMGGTWGMTAAVPTNENDQRLFEPGKLGTLLVALGLFLFGLINLFNTGWISLNLERDYGKYGILIIAILFALRCMGDFRYVGFSKRFKTSYFARMDSKYFSPLCLFLALSHLYLFIA